MLAALIFESGASSELVFVAVKPRFLIVLSLGLLFFFVLSFFWYHWFGLHSILLPNAPNLLQGSYPYRNFALYGNATASFTSYLGEMTLWLYDRLWDLCQYSIPRCRYPLATKTETFGTFTSSRLTYSESFFFSEIGLRTFMFIAA